jgi:hypothetical protein
VVEYLIASNCKVLWFYLHLFLPFLLLLHTARFSFFCYQLS